MNNLNKLNKIISDRKSTWVDEAQWREENETWVSLSFDIAIRVLGTLKTKGMTQKDLAEKMDVSPQFVNKVVKGQENLSLETIGKLSHALGIKLIEVPNEEVSGINYDYEQVFEISEIYRKQIFAKALDEGVFGLIAMQEYRPEKTSEFKISA